MGQPATSTRYIGSDAYISRVTAYTSLYKPSTSKVTIPRPGAEALAGTYEWTTAYYFTGQVKWTPQPAMGGLPRRRLSLPRYTSNSGLPVTLAAGTTSLISAVTYDHYGRPPKPSTETSESTCPAPRDTMSTLAP